MDRASFTAQSHDELDGVSFGVTVGSVRASGWSAMGSDLDAAKRMDAMAANIEQLRKEADDARTEHTAATTKLRTDMESKTRAIEERLSGTTLTLHESQTGGLWMAWVALAMLFVGTALASFPTWAGATTAAVNGLAKASAESPVIPDIYSIPPAAPDRRGTERQPLIVSKPTQELHSDDVDRVDHANDERVTTIATIVLAGFTALLWGANIWLVIATNRVSARQAQDTQSAIREATRSASAMEAVATATTSNAMMMRDIFSKQMRAYLSVEGGSAWRQTTAARFQGIPVITNHGLTPAKNVCWKVLVGILDISSGTPSLPEIGELIVSDMSIAPRQQFIAASPLVDRVSDEEAELIAKGDTRRLFVWGRVTYDDIFDGHWETNFCIGYHFWMLDEKIQFGITYTPRHNDST
jgi:hypothetical protein